MKKIGILFILLVSLLHAATTDDSYINSTPFLISSLLLLVSMVIFYTSLVRMQKIKEKYEILIQDQTFSDENQAGMITSMGENISKITQEAIEHRNRMLKNAHDKSLEYILTEVIKTERVLLDKTNDLIGFLKLKSRRIKITNEFFNINNVFNEISGSLASTFKGTKVHLIFDINNDVPRYLIGDSLYLGQILHNLLEHSLIHTIEGEVVLKVSIFYTYEKKSEMQFQILDSGIGFTPEKLDKLFIPQYNDQNGEYEGLGNFISKELVELMGGELIVESAVGKGTTFTVTLPLQLPDVARDRRYELPEVLTTKKVFIVDSNHDSAVATKKLFAYFKHEVKIYPKASFVHDVPDLEEYDIVVIDEELFTQQNVRYLQKLKQEKDVKIIGLGSLLRQIENPNSHSLYDKRLKKPLHQERIYDLLMDLYMQEDKYGNLTTREQKQLPRRTLVTHREPIQESPNVTRDSFGDFESASLLIVEDNLINQKVLTTILGTSNIKLTIANNGQEALDILTLRNKRFDLVLMDINMPIMDGYTATRHIRSKEEFDTLPVIAFTALVLESEIQKMFTSGVNAFLEKPLNIAKLYTVFDFYLASHKNPERVRPKVTPISIPETSAINFKEGLKHSQGNEALYMELLNEFVNTYGDSGKLFEKLLKEQRYEQIKMLCIDMKGLAGAIGAKDMYEKVDEIHKLFIYNNKSLLNNYTKVYNDEVIKLTNSIQEYLHSKNYT